MIDNTRQTIILHVRFTYPLNGGVDEAENKQYNGDDVTRLHYEMLHRS